MLLATAFAKNIAPRRQATVMSSAKTQPVINVQHTANLHKASKCIQLPLEYPAWRMCIAWNGANTAVS